MTDCCKCRCQCDCQKESWPQLKEYKFVITGTKRKDLKYVRTYRMWVYEGEAPTITVKVFYEKDGVEKVKEIICKPISDDVMLGVWE